MQALVNLSVDAANIAYENSQINMRIRLVHQALISYTESGSTGTDLTRLTYNDGYMESIFGLRKYIWGRSCLPAGPLYFRLRYGLALG